VYFRLAAGTAEPLHTGWRVLALLLGGDSSPSCCGQLEGDDYGIAVADRILECPGASPSSFGEQELSCGRVGASFYPEDGTDAYPLMNLMLTRAM